MYEAVEPPRHAPRDGEEGVTSPGYPFDPTPEDLGIFPVHGFGELQLWLYVHMVNEKEKQDGRERQRRGTVGDP